MSRLVRRLRMLFFLFTATSCDDAYNLGMSPQTSFRCSEHDIRYPFYLYNEAETTDGEDSAYSGMAIVCENNTGTAILKLSEYNYTILHIDYDSSTITLAYSDVLGNCPRVQHNVTIPEPLLFWLNFNSSVTENLYFFLNCPPMPATQQQPDTFEIKCMDDGGHGLSSFVFPQVRVPDVGWQRQCKEVWVVPVLRDGLGDYSHSHLGNDGYGTLMKKGFQLTWDPTDGRCKKGEQSKGQCTYRNSSDFLCCLCSHGQLQTPVCRSKHTQRKEIIIDTISAASGVILLSLLLSACALYHKKSHGLLSPKRGLKNTIAIESFLQKHGTTHPKKYTYSEVKRMTKSFAHKLGQGGCGTVYKGNMQDGRQIAVKMLKLSKDDGQEFMNEVASMSKTSHVNVVTLLGYCLQGSKRALIYEYMPNGSLERFAFGHNSDGEKSLNWEQLFDIVIGIARGLEYLHRGCNTRIVHLDIKPHNILLDNDFCPKISDFGMAKLCMKKESVISIDGARGTIGYIAPEVFSKQFGVVSSKSDVYSYGMMILEMVGARKKIDVCTESSSEYFPQWIYEHFEQYCADSCEISLVTNELVRKMITVGLWCILLLPSNRPSMSRVVEMLESSSNDPQIPPQSLLI